MKRMAKNFLFHYSIISLIIIFLFSCAKIPEYRTAVFFYTNDIHGQVNPLKSSKLNKDNPPLVGGSAALSYYLNKEEKLLNDSGIPYFIFDSGDFFQGSAESIFTNGKIMTAVMNYLKYDASTLGNHEFDYGYDALKELINSSDFDFISANIIDKTDTCLNKVKVYKIIEKHNLKIGVLGLITSELFKVTSQEKNKFIELKSYEESIKSGITYLKKNNCDLIVILAHCDLNDNQNYASKIPEIDIIFGGHDHIALDTPILANNTRTIICESGSKLQALGMLKIIYDKPHKKIIQYENKLIPLIIDTNVLSASNNMETVLKPYTDKIEPILNEIIGYCETDLVTDKSNPDKNIGIFLTSVLKNKLKTDIAIYNKTGIRSNLLKGNIALRDIYSIEPFGNTVYIVKLKGAELLEMFKYAFSNPYTYLDFSGMDLYLNFSDSNIVSKIIINDTEIVPDKEYTAAVPNFIATGGDGHYVFQNNTNKYDTKLLIRDIYIDYIKTVQNIKADDIKNNLFIIQNEQKNLQLDK